MFKGLLVLTALIVGELNPRQKELTDDATVTVFKLDGSSSKDETSFRGLAVIKVFAVTDKQDKYVAVEETIKFVADGEPVDADGIEKKVTNAEWGFRATLPNKEKVEIVISFKDSLLLINLDNPKENRNRSVLLSITEANSEKWLKLMAKLEK